MATPIQPSQASTAASPTPQPKLKLYWLNESRSQRIIWLLEALGLEYEVEVFRRKPDMLAPPELERLHPLGKAPLLALTPADGGAPVLLAESGLITQYLCDHFAAGTGLVPAKWRDGLEGRPGGETPGWLRFQHLLHYSEGSLMPVLVMLLVMNQLKSSSIPFFIRPISSTIANRVIAAFIFPNVQKHFAFLEGLLTTAPGGPYLCGPDLTAADILMSYPLVASKGRLQGIGRWERGSVADTYPNLAAYVERLETSPGYVAAVEKMQAVEGKPKESKV